uniref:Adaptor related protein complex 3 subunit mu 2 n=2 Tax=Passerellidae TaxID=1729112 RepID=A0A8D2QBT3_ZONAL
MIHSLFLINASGDIFLEKHWKSVVSRSVCDYFFEAQERASEAENVPPVIPTPHHYLLSVYRHKIFFVAVIQSEVPPLFVIEFLHRVVDTFQDYFGVCSEVIIKDNVVVVYEVLEEMLDNGFPLATESNILKELIKPPTILRTVVNTITGSTNVGDQLPTGQLSVVPWRRTGVKYTNNEAYFDVVEEIDAIIDKSGSTITAEIQGVIDACVKLTGMPDLTLSFMNPRLLDDVSFHPCVRFKRWESERILSFIPPDGNFRLLSYHVSAQNLVAIPVYVKHNISFRDSSSLGRFEITVGPKQTMGKTVEGVMVTSQMPKSVLNMTLTPSQGTHAFDPVTKLLSWDVGKINPQKLPSLKGSVSLQAGTSKPDENPTINLQFKIQQLAISEFRGVLNPAKITNHFCVNAGNVSAATADAPADDPDQVHPLVLQTHQGPSRVALQRSSRPVKISFFIFALLFPPSLALGVFTDTPCVGCSQIKSSSLSQINFMKNPFAGSFLLRNKM